jgi:hypothetical protein
MRARRSMPERTNKVQSSFILAYVSVSGCASSGWGVNTDVLLALVGEWIGSLRLSRRVIGSSSGVTSDVLGKEELEVESIRA